MAECNFKPTLTAKPFRAVAKSNNNKAGAPEVHVNGL